VFVAASLGWEAAGALEVLSLLERFGQQDALAMIDPGRNVLPRATRFALLWLCASLGSF